jgi:hypothetical protein
MVKWMVEWLNGLFLLPRVNFPKKEKLNKILTNNAT